MTSPGWLGKPSPLHCVLWALVPLGPFRAWVLGRQRLPREGRWRFLREACKAFNSTTSSIREYWLSHYLCETRCSAVLMLYCFFWGTASRMFILCWRYRSLYRGCDSVTEHHKCQCNYSPMWRSSGSLQYNSCWSCEAKALCLVYPAALP